MKKTRFLFSILNVGTILIWLLSPLGKTYVSKSRNWCGFRIRRVCMNFFSIDDVFGTRTVNKRQYGCGYCSGRNIDWMIYIVKALVYQCFQPDCFSSFRVSTQWNNIDAKIDHVRAIFGQIHFNVKCLLKLVSASKCITTILHLRFRNFNSAPFRAIN